MEGKVVVLPLDTFLEQFVPIPATLVEPFVQFAELDLSPVAVKSEPAMYNPLMDALNHEWLLRKYIVHATPHKSDSNVASAGGIDGGLYAPDCVPEEADMTDWETIEVGIACKTEVSHDPVQELQASLQPAGDERGRVLRQIMSYAAIVFDNQHRTHQFSLILFGTMARLARWDRAGVIFSETFDYVKGPTNIARFLWRYVRMTPEQQGHDTIATKVHPKSKDYELVLERAKYPLMIGGHKVGEHARREFAKSTKDARWFWKLKVSDGKKAREFLVGRPHFIAYGLAGRGTKGFVAIDCNDPEGPLVYLKDVWRVAHPELRREGDILAHLNGGQDDTPVENVPTLICHGDVGDQATMTQEVWKEKNPTVPEERCPLKIHRHYRLVMKEVALPITSFKCGLELVFLFVRAITAHQQAYQKGVLHRDISSGNVLIQILEVVDPENPKILKTSRDVLLADWELSDLQNDGDGGPRPPRRIGTWQFASASALNDLSKKIDVADEMESFFHLFLYLAIRYLPHNVADVGSFIHKYFDDHEVKAGEYHCGNMKFSCMLSGEILHSGTSVTFYAFPPPLVPKESRTGAASISTSAPQQTEIGLPKPVHPELHGVNDSRSSGRC
ncbi:hypothetical protein C8Q77DRAFT_325598 [Trametes polyzona]|nr:hypothetical protein C8Q77DRAFT_325598 [Trametes polyzona]